jgi:TetR/AcrR family transcriptional repressor of mexJK operon
MPRPALATRERILAAALTRFARYGFRRTSMADIAAEAGLSRAALYLQFPNKEAIFRGLSEHLHDEALARASAVLAGDGPLADRLRAAIEAKTQRFVEIAYGSPHGSELLDENSRLCGDLAARMGERFQALVTAVLRRAARAGEIDLEGVALSAPEAAELFVHGVAGLKGPGVTPERYRQRLAAHVRVFVAALGVAPSSRRPGRRQGTGTPSSTRRTTSSASTSSASAS